MRSDSDGKEAKAERERKRMKEKGDEEREGQISWRREDVVESCILKCNCRIVTR